MRGNIVRWGGETETETFCVIFVVLWSRGRQGEGAVFDGPAVSSGSVSPSSPVLCCPLGISEHESAGPFLNVQKKVQVCGEGSSL